MGAARRAVCATAALLLLAATGCSDDQATGSSEPTDWAGHEPVGTTERSSPFRVGQLPNGYRLVDAGRGDHDQLWGSDSFGTEEPVTYLAPVDDGPGGDGEAQVRLTGYRGYQGGLGQASAGYLSDQAREFEVDGRPAIYTPPGVEGEDAPADLVMAIGRDVAVRVSVADGTQDAMVEIARTVRAPTDHLRAPVVEDPPDGLDVVGAADADVMTALGGLYPPTYGELPGSPRAHVVVAAVTDSSGRWTQNSDNVTVTTLPGTALDLDAVASLDLGDGDVETSERTLAGRRAVVVDLVAEPSEDSLRAVLTSTADGDLLIVRAEGRDRPEVEELVAVAESVEPAHPADWRQFVASATTGPTELDPGAVELRRGTTRGVEWLFQAGPDADWRMYPGPRGRMLADPCLKLSTGIRACPDTTHAAAQDELWIGTRADEPQAPGFIVVMTAGPARGFRLQTGEGAVEAALTPIPNGRWAAGVLLTDRIPSDVLTEAAVRCVEPGDPLSAGAVQLLDAAGRSLPCSAG
jgi:hypothetical protein